MNSEFIFGISLTASFLAGILALFAPCCITFLFPAYLGTIFKDNKKVVLYTLIFALGLGTILVPVALGFRYFISFFDEYHQIVYYAGALVMIFMGIMTVKPIFHLPQIVSAKPISASNASVLSVFILGIISGITSACCAPVLFAAVTLTTLSPTTFQAIIVAIAYVLGIVFPLFVLSLSYKKFSVYLKGEKRQKFYEVIKYVGAGIFIISGLAIAVFNYFEKIEKYQMESYSNNIRMLVLKISTVFKNPALDIGVFLLILVIIYLLAKTARNNKE